MLITNQNTMDLGTRKRTIGREVKIGPVSLSFVSIIILAALALFYLAESTQSATKNYQVRELEDQKNQLVQEQQRLEVESVRLKSLGEIKQSTENGNLEENKNSFYAPSPTPSPSNQDNSTARR